MAHPVVTPRAGSPERLRQWFEQRGPLYIKIGQFLALRPDVIPQEYCDALLRLFDRAPTFPWQTARDILTADLGGPPERHFAWIDPNPLAAASLAQVHVGYTHDQQAVCIKIQRPGIRDQIFDQLRHPRALRRLLDDTRATVLVSADELIGELQRWMERELDFRLELDALVKMDRLYADDPHVRVPRPFPALSGERVITSEYLRGPSFSRLLELTHAGARERLAELGVDPQRLAENLIRSVLKQIFVRRLFHADPHPGNLVALPRNMVGFVDFGLVDQLDDSAIAELGRYLMAIYSGDAERMYHALLQIMIAGPHADAERFHAAFLAETRDLLRAGSNAPAIPDERSPLSRYLIAVMRAGRENDFRLPPHLLSVYRALLTAESVAQKLGGDAEIREVGRSFFARLQVENTVRAFDHDQITAFGTDTLALLKDAPGLVHRLLSDLSDQRFLLHVQADQSKDDRIESNHRARLVATSVLSVTLAILLVGLDASSIVPVKLVFGALLGTCLFYMLLVWRRLS